MHECARCGETVGDAFRYCPWCAAPQRMKLVEFFRAHPSIGPSDKALRVSRYLDDQVADRHVRFSIWSTSAHRAHAEAVVSLADDEAARLTRFLAGSAPAGPPRRRTLRDLVDHVSAKISG
jgi:hypothetical protein